MLFKIEDRCRSSTSSKLLNIVQNDFEFFLLNMFSDAERARLQIVVKVYDGLNPDVAAATAPNYKRPGAYSICVARKVIKENPPFRRKVAAHELIHVRQFLRGRLEVYGGFREGCIMWCGKQYSTSIYGFYTDEEAWPYNKIPWEKEADEMGRKWVEKYESFLKRIA